MNAWYAVVQNKSINNVYSFSDEIFISDIFSCFDILWGYTYSRGRSKKKKGFKDKFFFSLLHALDVHLAF